MPEQLKFMLIVIESSPVIHCPIDVKMHATAVYAGIQVLRGDLTSTSKKKKLSACTEWWRVLGKDRGSSLVPARPHYLPRSVFSLAWEAVC